MMERHGKLERDEVVAALVLGVIGAVFIGVQGFVASRSQRLGASPDLGLDLRARFDAVRERLFPTPAGEVEPSDADLAAMHDEARRITREG